MFCCLHRKPQPAVSETVMDVFSSTSVSPPEQKCFVDGVGHEEQVPSDCNEDNTVKTKGRNFTNIAKYFFLNL